MKEERLKMLQDTPIFGGIRDDILDFLLEDAVEISLKEGDVLFSENDPGNTVFVLEEGKVAVLKLWNGVYYRLNCLNAGDCIGEMSFIDLGRRSASVVAMSDCKAVELTSAALFKLYNKDLEQFALIQMNMSRELSRRLRKANDRLFLEQVNSNQISEH